MGLEGFVYVIGGYDGQVYLKVSKSLLYLFYI